MTDVLSLMLLDFLVVDTDASINKGIPVTSQ